MGGGAVLRGKNQKENIGCPFDVLLTVFPSLKVNSKSPALEGGDALTGAHASFMDPSFPFGPLALRPSRVDSLDIYWKPCRSRAGKHQWS